MLSAKLLRLPSGAVDMLALAPRKTARDGTYGSGEAGSKHLELCTRNR